MVAGMVPKRACRDCDRWLLAQDQWRALPYATRRGLAAEGWAVHKGRGLCGVCYRRRSKNDTLLDVPKAGVERDLLVAEWDFFAKSRPTHRQNVRAFAEYMKMPFPTVERALLRAGVRAGRS